MAQPALYDILARRPTPLKHEKEPNASRKPSYVRNGTFPKLLEFLSTLGVNIPNYMASIAAFV
jgi:hypothetical protein